MDGESLSSTDLAVRRRIAQAGGTFGTVSGTPDYVMGELREVRTGLTGLAAPNVASSVTLGGELHVDVTGLSNGTYTLISADTVTGAFDTVTAAGNAAKDLTIDTSGNQVRVTVADGSGLIG